jgi:hypothetical protein
MATNQSDDSKYTGNSASTEANGSGTNGSGTNGSGCQTQGGTQAESGLASQSPAAIPVGSLRVPNHSGADTQGLRVFYNYTETEGRTNGT